MVKEKDLKNNLEKENEINNGIPNNTEKKKDNPNKVTLRTDKNEIKEENKEEQENVVTKLKEDKSEKQENVTNNVQEDSKQVKEENTNKKEKNTEEASNYSKVDVPKYVPYSPVIKNKKNKKKNKVVEPPDIEKEFNRLKIKRKRRIILILALVLIILIIGIFCTGFALVNVNSTTILEGVSIRGIEIGGLTKEEAINTITEQTNNEKTREIKLIANGETTTITLEQIEIEYLIEDAVNKAYELGRNGNIFQNNFTILNSIHNKQNIDLEINYNEKLLNNIISTINATLPNAMVDNTYNIEDSELIITRGTAGLVLNNEQSKEKIIQVAKEGSFSDIELVTTYQECPDIDIDKIYEEVYTEPQNAYYTTDPFQIYPHVNGVDFNVEAAKEMLKESKEEYVIALTITEPETLTSEIGTEAFPDLLSSFSTKYDQSNVSRTTNVTLATEKINGTIVMPGEVFSYNQTVGKRTVEAGYKNANGFAGGRVVPMLGGGICQVSSTLYDAVVYANLNIVERHNHMFQATYVEPGKDATVVYGSLDFKFENTRKYPIMIQASAKAGTLQVKIFGVKEEVEYEIEIVTKVLSYTPYKTIYETDSSLAAGQERVSQYGIQGCKSITYKIVKQNGVEIERIVLSSDTYDPQNKIVRRGPTRTSTSTTPTTTPSNTETPTTSTETPSSETNTNTNTGTTTEKPATETPTTTTETPPTTETPSTSTEEQTTTE